MPRLLQVQLRWHLQGWCPLQSVPPSGTLRGPTKHPLGICSNQLRGQRFCRWVSSNGRVSHPKFERAQVLQRCAAWVSPLSLGLSPWRSTTVSSATTSCGVRSPARLDVRQSHMLFLQPDCDTVVAPLADFRSADGADLPCGPLALRHAPLASGQCWRHMMWSVGLERACHT